MARMKVARVLAVGIAVAVIESRVPGQETQGSREKWFTFDDAEEGKAPAGWRIGQANPTEAMATWAVVKDESASSGQKVFGVTRTKNSGSTYNVAMAEDTSFAGLDVTVRSKAVSGEEDQGGGVIWRCRDENNYYICRFNPLEGNFRAYKVVDGDRKMLASAQVVTKADTWYTIQVVMAGTRMACYLNGEKWLEADDDVFGQAGMVGLWTKADAVTYFDDLVVREYAEVEKTEEKGEGGGVEADAPR